MKTVGEYSLDKKQRINICGIINSYGSGQHAYADLETVDGFTQPYILGLLKKAKRGNLIPEKETIVDELILKFTN